MWHRRLHVTKVTCLNLLMDLLLGAGKLRCLRTVRVTLNTVEVHIRAFSAGSYSGLTPLYGSYLTYKRLAPPS